MSKMCAFHTASAQESKEYTTFVVVPSILLVRTKWMLELIVCRKCTYSCPCVVHSWHRSGPGASRSEWSCGFLVFGTNKILIGIYVYRNTGLRNSWRPCPHGISGRHSLLSPLFPVENWEKKMLSVNSSMICLSALTWSVFYHRLQNDITTLPFLTMFGGKVVTLFLL